MSVSDAADATRSFARGKSPELLYLQNCSKGTIEVQYEFRDCAKFILSSQTLLGAPNYYYEETLRDLAENPEADGLELAKSIIAHERAVMFDGLCVVDNRSLGDVPCYLDHILDPALRSEVGPLCVADSTCYEYAGDCLLDVTATMHGLATWDPTLKAACASFLEFYRDRFLAFFHRSPLARRKDLSGLSLVLPKTAQHLERYRRLDLYRDSRLGAFVEGMIRCGEEDRSDVATESRAPG